MIHASQYGWGGVWLRPLHRETIMKKAIALILVALAVTSCTQTEKGAGIPRRANNKKSFQQAAGPAGRQQRDMR